MRIDGVSQSSGDDRVVVVEAAGAGVSVAVTDRSGTILMGKAVVPSGELLAVLSD